MPPKKRHASSALKPLKAPKASKTLRAPKPPKAPQAWESYSQSFQATQYTHNSLAVEVVQPPEALVAPVAVQQMVTLSEDIKEAWPGSQMEDFEEDKFGAIFKAHGKIVENKADEVNKTKLLKLLAEKVAKMGLFIVLTI